MRVFLVSLLCGLGLVACADETDRPFAFRGMRAGMSLQELRSAAGAAGSTIECRPLSAPGVPADLLCFTPDSTSSLVHVAGIVQTRDSTLPYLAVREGMTSPAAYDHLGRLWGEPDTVIGTARRWTHGRWMVNADTAADILTVWLSDSTTEMQMALASTRELRRRAGTDTLPVFTDESATLASLLADSAGRSAPVLAAALSRKPSVIGCTRVQPPASLAGIRGIVIVAYIVDTVGRVEPENVRVLQASHEGLIDAALGTIRSCTLVPGRLAGRAVRSVVQQRVSFTPGS